MFQQGYRYCSFVRDIAQLLRKHFHVLTCKQLQFNSGGFNSPKYRLGINFYYCFYFLFSCVNAPHINREILTTARTFKFFYFENGFACLANISVYMDFKWASYHFQFA